MPLPRSLISGNFGQAALAQDRRIVGLDIKAIDRFVVMFLNQQPFRPFASRPPAAHLDQREIALQSLACETKFQIALGQHLRGFGFGAGNVFSIYWHRREWLPRAHIPDHDGACAVIVLGDDAFEIEIGDGMIFDLHGQALIGGIERRAFGHGPRFEDAFHLQAEVVVQPRGVVLLHYETVARFFFDLGRGLGRFFKPAFARVLFEGHGG